MNACTKSSQFILKFPENSGFETTEINFYTGNPALESLFLTQNESLSYKRIFVTDESIAALDSMKGFVSMFTKQECSFLEAPAWFATRDTDGLLVLGAGEAYKTIESVLAIVKSGIEFNMDRNGLFVAIGGGVICDMTGFAASMFKRGVEVEFVPTTLLAMVDASVGGKTGCDFEGYKNMIGAFYPARKLHVWPSFVQTLSEKEYISGLSEAIKTALLFSENSVKMFEENTRNVLSRDQNVLEGIITECVKAKAAIVSEDLKEKGRRAFLNLGHTFGHALEATAGLGTISHGAAVAWGMGRAAQLSFNLNLCSREYLERTIKLLESYGYDTSAYPKVLESQSINKDQAVQQMMKAMHKDKKNNSASLIRVTIQKNVENTLIHQVNEESIISVIK